MCIPKIIALYKITHTTCRAYAEKRVRIQLLKTSSVAHFNKGRNLITIVAQFYTS